MERYINYLVSLTIGIVEYWNVGIMVIRGNV
jgi:hypothetical protein